MRVLGLESGTFGARHRSRGTMFRAFWRLGRVWAKVGLSAQGTAREGASVWHQAIWLQVLLSLPTD